MSLATAQGGLPRVTRVSIEAGHGQLNLEMTAVPANTLVRGPS